MKTVTRMLLTFLAGYCDTATFVHMKGVFSAHVTGNFILFAAAMTRGVQTEDYLKLLTFPVFVVAVAAGTVVYVRAEKQRKASRKTSGLCQILSLIALLLLASSFLGFAQNARADLAITILVVLAMGLQNSLHHFNPGAMTTVMTGTVMNTVAGLTERAIKADTETQPTVVRSTAFLILLFGCGCVIAAFASLQFQYISLLVPAVVAIGVWRLEKASAAREAPHSTR